MLASKHLVDLLLEAFRVATGPQDCMIILATLEVTPERLGADSATARLYWRRPALFGTVLLRVYSPSLPFPIGLNLCEHEGRVDPYDQYVDY